MVRNVPGISCILALLTSGACLSAEPEPLAPIPRTVRAPHDNPSSAEKIQLGKQLFFDPRLSGDNKLSCATCHLPSKGFGDGLKFSAGASGTPLSRNTQGLLDVAHMQSFFWDGRVRSLEEQALIPIAAEAEMHQPLRQLESELAAVDGYAKQFKAVFGSGVTRSGIAKAIAAFERTLVTGSAPFDRYLRGDDAALSSTAIEGLRLFQGEADCFRCHNGPLLSDGKFYRLGVSLTDRGRGAVTGNKNDDFKFRTPTLRNIALTAPYMHDGSIATLDDVVLFYYRGVPRGTPDLPLDVEPLTGQSFSEMTAIVAFLRSLTGTVPKIDPPELPE